MQFESSDLSIEVNTGQVQLALLCDLAGVKYRKRLSSAAWHDINDWLEDNLHDILRSHLICLEAGATPLFPLKLKKGVK